MGKKKSKTKARAKVKTKARVSYNTKARNDIIKDVIVVKAKTKKR